MFVDALPVPNRTLYQADPRPDITHVYRFSLSSLGSSVPNRAKKSIVFPQFRVRIAGA